MKIDENKLREIIEEILAPACDEDQAGELAEEILQRAADEAEEL